MFSDKKLTSRLKNGSYFAINNKVRFRDDSLLLIKKTEIEGLGAACDGLVADVVGIEEIGGIRRVDLAFGNGQILRRVFASELELA